MLKKEKLIVLKRRREQLNCLCSAFFPVHPEEKESEKKKKEKITWMNV